jgi:hypothetical protein
MYNVRLAWAEVLFQVDAIAGHAVFTSKGFSLLASRTRLGIPRHNIYGGSHFHPYFISLLILLRIVRLLFLFHVDIIIKN